MDEKQELNDILITEDVGSEVGNTKKMILLGAAAVMLLLIILFGFYSMTKKTGDDEAPVATQEDLLKKQGLEKLDTKEIKEVSEGGSKFEQVPIKEEPKTPEAAAAAAPATTETKPESVDKFEEIVRQIKEKENAANGNKELPSPPPLPEAKVEAAPAPAAPAPKQEAPKAPAPKVAEKPKTPVAPFPDNVAAPTQKGDVYSIPKGFYIQVGSFSNAMPDKKFISLIEKNGYSYKIQKIDGGSKVLIGPYATKGEVSENIGQVREKIAKGAFLKSF